MNNQADFPAPATPGGMAPEFFIKTLRYLHFPLFFNSLEFVFSFK